MTANKQSSAPNHPRLSDSVIKPNSTRLLRDAGLVHHGHQEPRLHVRIPVPNVPRQGHHHHHHDDDEEEEEAEIAAFSQAQAAPTHISKRPAINRGIAVNIAFRIAALDIDCEGYMYMLTQTGDHECGHPILPVKARGCEWRAFRDDMLTRFGWGSVLSATWLQSYNWACRVLNIEVDRILVGIDTQTSLVNAAKSQFGLDSTQYSTRASHSCPISDPSSTRPSTSAQQSSTSAQLGGASSPPKSVSTKSNVDHHTEPRSLAGISSGIPGGISSSIPSGSAGAKLTKNKASKASSATATGGSKIKTEKRLGIAENSSVKKTPTKSGGPKNHMKGEEEEKEEKEARCRNPIEAIYNTFRARIRENSPPSTPSLIATPVVDPIPPKTVFIPVPPYTSSTPTTSSPSYSSASDNNNKKKKMNNNSTPPPINISQKPPSHSPTASTITIAPLKSISPSNPSPSTPTTPSPNHKKNPRNRNRNRKSPCHNDPDSTVDDVRNRKSNSSKLIEFSTPQQ